MTTTDISVLLVDDHPVVRMGLAQAIGGFAAIHVAGEADTGEEALFLCRKLRPDIVIMDLRMDGMGGIEAAKVIHDHAPATRVIALSSFVDRAMAARVMDAGVAGFILKNFTVGGLEAAIRAVHAGETVICDEVRQLLAASSAVSAVPDVHLGDQQRKVLALMTKGLTNGEIARHMGLSMPTARYHVSAILDKLGVSNRTEASAMAIANGLIGADDI